MSSHLTSGNLSAVQMLFGLTATQMYCRGLPVSCHQAAWSSHWGLSQSRHCKSQGPSNMTANLTQQSYRAQRCSVRCLCKRTLFTASKWLLRTDSASTPRYCTSTAPALFQSSTQRTEHLSNAFPCTSHPCFTFAYETNAHSC